MALGIVLGESLRLPPLLLALALAPALALTLTLEHRPALWLTVSGLAVILAGISLGTPAVKRACEPINHLRRGEKVRVVGRIATAARRGEQSQHQQLALSWRLDGGAPGRICGAVMLLRQRDAPALHPGEEVLVRGKLGIFTGNRNPGAGSGPGGAPMVRLVAAAGEAVILEGRHRAPWFQRLRLRLGEQLGNAVKDPDRRALLAALIIGDRSSVSVELREAFARAGTSHLLAISGLHLALVALGVAALSRRLLLWIPIIARSRDPGRLAVVPAAAAALFYTGLTGAAPPTARACVLVLCLGVARLAHRPTDLVRPLAMAALLLLLLHPPTLFAPGFQLSFVAVAGIALAVRRFPAGAPLRAGLAGRVHVWLRGIALASTAATLVTTPLVAHHFGQATAAGLVVNMAAIPWTSLVLLPAALAGALVMQVWAMAGGHLFALAAWAAGVLADLCVTAAAWPVAIKFSPPGWPLTVALTLLALGALLPWRRPRRVTVCVAMLLILAAVAVPRVLRRDAPLELTFLDVGQGDSTFITTAGGFAMLVDGGGDPAGRADPGLSRVVPYLRWRGVRRLDLVVATHPHADHIAGLGAVMEAVEVGELWVCWHEEQDPWLEALLAAAASNGVPVSPPRLLELDGLTIRPLWPAGYGGRCADPARDANDNSIVLRLELGGAAVLLPGDVEQGVEQELVARFRGLLQADVLKAPHHGSGTSSSPGFLAAVDPRMGVISCGLHNSFGIPPARVLRRYRRQGVELARVDRDGAIGVHLWPDGTLRWKPLVGRTPWRWLRP